MRSIFVLRDDFPEVFRFAGVKSRPLARRILAPHLERQGEIEPITREEFARELRKIVARARREYPPNLGPIPPPIDAAKLKALAPGPIYEGFEEDVKRMRRGLEPLGPRE